MSVHIDKARLLEAMDLFVYELGSAPIEHSRIASEAVREWAISIRKGTFDAQLEANDCDECRFKKSFISDMQRTRDD